MKNLIYVKGLKVVFYLEDEDKIIRDSCFTAIEQDSMEGESEVLDFIEFYVQDYKGNFTAVSNCDNLLGVEFPDETRVDSYYLGDIERIKENTKRLRGKQ